MSAATTSRKRVAWVVAVAALLAVADRLFGPDAADELVVGAVVKERTTRTTGDNSQATRARSTGTAAPGGAEAELARLDRWQLGLVAAARTVEGAGEDDAEPGSDPFAPVAWAAPAASAARAPVVVLPPPPPPPVAPPFPYAYVGGLVEDGVRTLFFAKGERVLPVKAGDVVDTTYRIDEVEEKQMKLTYMPMNQSAVVALKSP